jgi:GH15 family glucan-1,4-alpha-glucosidase
VTAGGSLPIEDHGVIGNLATAALIGRDGAIDWCCLPAFDSPSCFASILDERAGGRFRVAPVGADLGDQRYVTDTNVLETSFPARDGRLVVTDFMPIDGDLGGRRTSVTILAELRRLVRAEGGDIEVEVEWSPRLDYARRPTRIEVVPGGALATSDGQRLSLYGLPTQPVVENEHDGSATLRTRFTLDAGRELSLVCGLESRPESAEADSRHWLARTAAAWRAWVNRDAPFGDRAWAAPHQDLVTRSELVLKLLSFRETGALVAAPTTSLPETLGGQRNWDYRYTWIRDASLTVQSMLALGHEREAIEFIDWAERVAQQGAGATASLQVLYGIRGERDLPEQELRHLAGHRGSRPVRIGNEAAQQKQLDIFGELLDGAYELAREGHHVADEVGPFLLDVADQACAAVGQPHVSIWEVRGPERVYTYSQLMIWVAIDRAIQLAERYGLDGGEMDRWQRSRKEVRALVLGPGFDEGIGAFVQAVGSADLDASSLLISLHELLAADDPRVISTIDRTLEQLVEDGLVYRYRRDDGLPGTEGAFVLCTCWLIDVLALCGRVSEARDLFDRLCARANHLGLYAEQIDPASGGFLGNFPQAFSHLGIINSAIYLAYAEGRESPAPEPVGSLEHRRKASRSVPGFSPRS